MKKAATVNVPLTQNQILMLKSLLGESQRRMVADLSAAISVKNEKAQKFYLEKMKEAETLESVLDKADSRNSDTSDDVADDEEGEDVDAGG